MKSFGKELIDLIRESDAYYKDLVTRSIYHSNAIEGNSLTLDEVYAILFEPNYVCTALHKEFYEVVNLKDVLCCSLKSLDEELSIGLIKQLGVMLNRQINEIDGFRKTRVVLQGVNYEPPNAYDVPRLLGEAILEYNKSEADLFRRISLFHIRFERIHPFSDGNGRVGRALIVRELVKNGLAPAVIPKSSRANYFNFLAQQDVDGLASYLRELSDWEFKQMMK